MNDGDTSFVFLLFQHPRAV